MYAIRSYYGDHIIQFFQASLNIQFSGQTTGHQLINRANIGSAISLLEQHVPGVGSWLFYQPLRRIKFRAMGIPGNHANAQAFQIFERPDLYIA